MGTSLVVQGLKFHTANVGGKGLLPGWGTKIPHAVWHGQKVNYLFIYFRLCWVFIAAGFSLVSASRGYSLVAVHWLLIVEASLVVEHGL